MVVAKTYKRHKNSCSGAITASITLDNQSPCVVASAMIPLTGPVENVKINRQTSLSIKDAQEFLRIYSGFLSAVKRQNAKTINQSGSKPKIRS